MRACFFFVVYVAANLGLVLYGVLALVTPGILLESFSVHVYQFPEDAARATAYLEALFRLLGLLNIIPGMLGLLLLRRLRMSWQPWILRVVIVSTVFAYLGPIVFDNTVGSIGPFEIVEHVLFALVVVLGLIMLRGQDAGRGFPHPVSPESVAGSPSNAAKVDASDIIPRLAVTRLGVWTIKRLVSPLQRWAYRGSGGRIFSTIGPDRNVLLLTTKGRRTGRDRTTPVFYLRDG